MARIVSKLVEASASQDVACLREPIAQPFLRFFQPLHFDDGHRLRKNYIFGFASHSVL
jgi:hypothetical protein